MKLKKGLLFISTLIVFLTALCLPYSYSDGFKFEFGYPLSYLTTYQIQEPIKRNEILLMRTGINVLNFIIDVALTYLILNLIQTMTHKVKSGFSFGHGSLTEPNDSLEVDPDVKKIIDKAGYEAEMILSDQGIEKGYRGYCHRYWTLQKKILKEKYKMDWQTPQEKENVRYD